jgi:hypothetical protein
MTQWARRLLRAAADQLWIGRRRYHGSNGRRTVQGHGGRLS